MSVPRQPRRLNKWVAAPAGAYRSGTELQCIPICFAVNEGGLGDFLTWIPALQWIAEECPHVHGTLLVHGFLLDLAKYFFDKYAHWKVSLIEDYRKIPGDMAAMGFVPGVSPSIFNAMSSRLSIPGWAYFANMAEIPEGWDVYPDLTDLESPDLGKLGLELSKYVCFTPGATAGTRAVPGSFLNPIIEWCDSQKLTPVFLGKSNLTPDLPVNFARARYDLGVDLRDQTTTLEAAAIMKYAYATLGLDNGLLHLAACTGGNVIFGYNITTVEHRRPRIRAPGRLIDVFLTKAELPCIGCQSDMALSVPHDFRFCLYTKRDAEDAQERGLPAPLAPKCIEMLFSGNSRNWIAALEMLKKEPRA